jgi:hypothetical protein
MMKVCKRCKTKLEKLEGTKLWRCSKCEEAAVDFLEIKKTIGEWAKERGIKVLDPDGFDRTRPDLWEMIFTEDEFEKGLMGSTIMGVDPSSGKEE